MKPGLLLAGRARDHGWTLAEQAGRVPRLISCSRWRTWVSARNGASCGRRAASLRPTYPAVPVCRATSAGVLFCHPNTIRHRLRRIESATGRSLSDPKTTAEILIAIEAALLLSESLVGSHLAFESGTEELRTPL
ncbi:helix-turn-helix domain-containing protein [Amycolatopsis sp. NPDC051061]|uniref:helix-turn-helix domain-containing protein n=1 Tax=Amycolatopsis sp. NPDC051061 TaxID=3155042 RepID=UPI003421D1A8